MKKTELSASKDKRMNVETLKNEVMTLGFRERKKARTSGRKIESLVKSDAMVLVGHLMNTIEHLTVEVEQLQNKSDGAYSERNKCVALVVVFARNLGYDVWLGKHVGEDWDDDWRNIVFVELPTGQVSWHVHDSELKLFEGLEYKDRSWDGHTTEEKYDRCARMY